MVLLLAAARLIREQGRRLRVRFVGSGPDAGELKREAEELGIGTSVVFEGRLDDAGLRACYAGADAFVLTSFFEGIPIVLMEAMALTIPCVAPWITGIPELITSGEDGLLFPPGDETAVAECIAALMDDPALRLRIGNNGREKVLRDYDIVKNSKILARTFLSGFQEPAGSSLEGLSQAVGLQSR
jgi:glycosyltransferase involved in cell wall biosynthesis